MSDMDPKTLQALKESIVKWDRNARVRNPKNVKITPDDCPLCLLFFDVPIDCVGCPVSEAGHWACQKTPYRLAYDEWADWMKEKQDGKDFRAAAKAEAVFLRSLLPEGETVE